MNPLPRRIPRRAVLVSVPQNDIEARVIASKSLNAAILSHMDHVANHEITPATMHRLERLVALAHRKR
jgi:hypothetical protein